VLGRIGVPVGEGVGEGVLLGPYCRDNGRIDGGLEIGCAGRSWLFAGRQEERDE